MRGKDPLISVPSVQRQRSQRMSRINSLRTHHSASRPRSVARCKSPCEPGTWGHTTFAMYHEHPFLQLEYGRNLEGGSSCFFCPARFRDTPPVLQPSLTGILGMQAHVIESYWLISLHSDWILGKAVNLVISGIKAGHTTDGRGIDCKFSRIDIVIRGQNQYMFRSQNDICAFLRLPSCHVSCDEPSSPCGSRRQYILPHCRFRIRNLSGRKTTGGRRGSISGHEICRTTVG